MRIAHLSDLHLGKRVNEFSMLEEQEYILEQILGVIAAEEAQAVVIAGDIYDRNVPPAEAVRLFDNFLCALSERRVQVFVISGNHDSPERIAFGARLMDASGVHLAPVYDGKVTPIELADEFGPVRFYLLPFVKPIHVRAAFPDAEIASYTDALRFAIAHMGVDTQVRNVLVAHQFVTGAATCDSEELTVGGLDNVDASAFDCFDYVALGHIHRPQSVGRPSVRYCGTPLKYSFSEKDDIKSLTLVELGSKGELCVRCVPLVPQHDMRQLRGSFEELIRRENWENTQTGDYLRVVLTDEHDVSGALSRLRDIYPRLMQLAYDNARTRSVATLERLEAVSRSSPMELFDQFYEAQNGAPMSGEQRAFCLELFKEMGGEAL